MLHLTILCVFAYCAGMIDAVVGGGGLIQIPALINVLPGTQDATIFGTNKFSSVWGTSLAARSYVGKVVMPWRLVLPAAISAFAMSFLGAATVSSIPQGVLRPLVLFLIVVMAIYIFMKKDFGAVQRPIEIGTRERALSVLIGGGIGFYDGLFGPGLRLSARLRIGEICEHRDEHCGADVFCSNRKSVVHNRDPDGDLQYAGCLYRHLGSDETRHTFHPRFVPVLAGHPDLQTCLRYGQPCLKARRQPVLATLPAC
jgi:hypothetical protein